MDRGEIRLKPTVDQGNNHKHSVISLQSRHSDADEWAMVQIFRVDSDTATLRVGEGFTKRRPDRRTTATACGFARARAWGSTCLSAAS